MNKTRVVSSEGNSGAYRHLATLMNTHACARAHSTHSLFCISRAGSPSSRGSRRGSQGCCGKWHQNKTSWYAEGPRDGCLLSSWRWIPAGTKQTLRTAGTGHSASTSTTTSPSLPTEWRLLQGKDKTILEKNCFPLWGQGLLTRGIRKSHPAACHAACSMRLCCCTQPC